MSDLSFIRCVHISFCRELKNIVADRLYLSVVSILPLISIIFFALMFYSGVIRDLPLAVVDSDRSDMSRKFVGMLAATRGVEPDMGYNSIQEAKSAVLRGNAVGLLHIEDGFEADLYRGERVSIWCYLPGTSLSVSGVVEREVQMCARMLSGKITLNRLVAKGENMDKVMVDVNPINLHINTISNPYMNYGYYLAPIFMFMALVIFTVVATTYALGRELYYATAAGWRSVVHGRMGAAMVGKMLPITLAMSLAMQLIFFVLFVIMGMGCAGSYLFLTLSSVLFIVAYQSIAVFIVTITSNMRLALSLGGGYSVMAFTFSGITFPIVSMYGVAGGLSKLFPLGYFSHIFIDQAMRGAPVGYSVDDMGALLIFVLLLVLGVGRLDRVTSDKRYWGRD